MVGGRRITQGRGKLSYKFSLISSSKNVGRSGVDDGLGGWRKLWISQWLAMSDEPNGGVYNVLGQWRYVGGLS